MGSRRTKKRAEERKKQQRKQRNRNITIGVVLLTVIIGALVILATRPVEIDLTEDVLTRYAGLPTSTTDRGFPILGNPDAPARLVEYSSFDCPSCRTFHENVTVNLLDRIRSGEASFTYVPVFGTGGIPNGDRAAAAAICAGQQGRFWEYHDLLFDWQGRYVASAFQPRRLEAGAAELGLDVEAFLACQTSAETEEVLDNAQSALAQSESTGTPTLFVNNQRVSSTLGAANTAIDQIMITADPVPVEVDASDEEATEDASDEEATEDASDEEATEDNATDASDEE